MPVIDLHLSRLGELSYFPLKFKNINSIASQFIEQMNDPKRFYTYAYLREDGSPYYIGKGQGRRIYRKGKNEVNPPKDKLRIIFLKQNLTEDEALHHERYMIAVFGRKDLGTGLLRNRSDGGVAPANLSMETRRKMSECRKGKNHPLYGKSHSEKSKRKMSEASKNPSEETRRKMSEAKKGKPLTEETKRKISKSLLGNNYSKGNKIDREIVDRLTNERKKNKWWNNECEQKFCPECPNGWKPGRLPLTGNYSKPGNKNSNSSHYKIEFNDGRCEIIFCLSEWAMNNNYKPNLLYYIVSNKRKSPHKDILRILKLTSEST
jgi:hypothetical protein